MNDFNKGDYFILAEHVTDIDLYSIKLPSSIRKFLLERKSKIKIIEIIGNKILFKVEGIFLSFYVLREHIVGFRQKHPRTNIFLDIKTEKD